MSIFERFFKAASEVGGETVVSAEELYRLAESNPVVDEELVSFQSRVGELKEQAAVGGGLTPADRALIEKYARESAGALSGYGIGVSTEAFLAVAYEA